MMPFFGLADTPAAEKIKMIQQPDAGMNTAILWIKAVDLGEPLPNVHKYQEFLASYAEKTAALQERQAKKAER